MQAVLSLYATDRTTGMVLDSGDGVTHAVLIYEGFTMPHSIMCIDIAGRDISHFLHLCLWKEGYDFHSSSDFEIVKAVKERACHLFINPQNDETLEMEKAQYYLHDGSTLIGTSKLQAPELLFRPDSIGEESEGAGVCYTEVTHGFAAYTFFQCYPLRRLYPVQRFWRHDTEGSEETSSKRCEDQDICTPGETIFHMEWRLYPCFTGHL